MQFLARMIHCFSRCLFEVYLSIVSTTQVQMCFAPDDEEGFFRALRAGSFDTKAVCSTIDAKRATATMEADKTMIMGKIQQDVGLDEYNKLAAMKHRLKMEGGTKYRI